MSFLSFFRKSQNVSYISLSGIIAPNMGRRKGLNLYELDKVIEQAFSVKNLKAVDYTFATDKEILDAYKLIAKTEGISAALEPMAGAAEVIKRAKGRSKDYLICLSLCGRGEKDLDTIQEHIGKDFE